MSNEGAPRRFAFILGGAFAIPGALCLAIAWRVFAADFAVRRWPRAPGTMTAARIERRMVQDTESAGYRTVPVDSAFVRYAYTVGGRTFEGTRLRREPSNADAALDLRRYAPGSTVQVAYDPADPSFAVLEEDPYSTGAMILGGGGAFFLLFGAAMTLAILRSQRGTPPATAG